jgi:hypothetical protein
MLCNSNSTNILEKAKIWRTEKRSVLPKVGGEGRRNLNRWSPGHLLRLWSYLVGYHELTTHLPKPTAYIAE